VEQAIAAGASASRCNVFMYDYGRCLYLFRLTLGAPAHLFGWVASVLTRLICTSGSAEVWGVVRPGGFLLPQHPPDVSSCLHHSSASATRGPTGHVCAPGPYSGRGWGPELRGDRACLVLRRAHPSSSRSCSQQRPRGCHWQPSCTTLARRHAPAHDVPSILAVELPPALFRGMLYLFGRSCC